MSFKRWNVVCLTLVVGPAPACGSSDEVSNSSNAGSGGATYDAGVITGGSAGASCGSCDTLGAECGNIVDDCGKEIYCGSCLEGEICGGDGPNQCGKSSCFPTTCNALGASCGTVSDGCGDTLDCGTCPPGQVCTADHECAPEQGGGGAAGDGGGGSCTPGTLCDDGNACTTGEFCNANGECGGGAATACTTPPNDCHVAPGTCDAATGACSYPWKANGTACADEGNPCTVDACDGAGQCMHTAVADGTPCGSGTCSGGVCSAGCSGGVTVGWSQAQSAWYGNTTTAGTYQCSGTVPAGTYPTGTEASPTLLDTTRRVGAATVKCVGGVWQVLHGTCDGRVVPTLLSVECNSNSMSSPRNLFATWYLNDLHYCGDTGGLDYWTSGYNGACNPPQHPDKDACWHDTFLTAAESYDNCHSQAQATGHICDYIENLFCPTGATYPWTSYSNNQAVGAYCKHRP